MSFKKDQWIIDKEGDIGKILEPIDENNNYYQIYFLNIMDYPHCIESVTEDFPIRLAHSNEIREELIICLLRKLERSKFPVYATTGRHFLWIPGKQYIHYKKAKDKLLFDGVPIYHNTEWLCKPFEPLAIII